MKPDHQQHIRWILPCAVLALGPTAWSQKAITSKPDADVSVERGASGRVYSIEERRSDGPRVEVRLDGPRVEGIRDRPVELELKLAQERSLERVQDDLTLLDDRSPREVERRVRVEPRVYTTAKPWHGAPDRILVVPGAEPDPKMMAETEEDLNVMAHLIEKAMGAKSSEGSLKAAGIDLLLSSSQSVAMRHLYLEGYGALFLFPSPIPLKPDAEDAEGEAKESASTSAWDEARRELYQAQEGGRFRQIPSRVETKVIKESYDAAKVERLKSSILDMLREASNLRHVKAGERITVVLTRNEPRGGPMDFARYMVQHTPAGPFLASSDADRARSQPATLVMRVMKEDVDALAKGGMNLEAFKAKAEVALY